MYCKAKKTSYHRNDRRALIDEYCKAEGMGPQLVNDFPINKGITLPAHVSVGDEEVMCRLVPMAGDNTGTLALAISVIDYDTTPISQTPLFSTPWVVAGDQQDKYAGQLVMQVKK